MRSFIGAYKVLSRVIPRRSSYLTPLDAVTAGRPSQESINWTDDLRAAFRSAQNALSSALTITLPRPEDQLWIVTDGAVRDPGIGATLYVTRGDKVHVSGFFSAKLWDSQTTWPSPLRLQRSTSARILFIPLKRRAFLLTVSLAFKLMRNSARGVLCQLSRIHFLVCCESLPSFSQARLRCCYPPVRLRKQKRRRL